MGRPKWVGQVLRKPSFHSASDVPEVSDTGNLFLCPVLIH